jgi:hypothetical protein
MWARGAAIRPVPAWAIVPREAFARVESELSSADDSEDDDGENAQLHRDFARFEETQPALAAHASEVLGRPLDDTALALGYFLTLAVWLGFESTFKTRLGTVDEPHLAATRTALAVEEELRASHAEEPLDLEDVVALEQPHALAFMNEHLEAALETTSVAEDREVDLDDVHLVYRMVVVVVLALSHAVLGPGEPGEKTEELLA